MKREHWNQHMKTYSPTQPRGVIALLYCFEQCCTARLSHVTFSSLYSSAWITNVNWTWSPNQKRQPGKLLQQTRSTGRPCILSTLFRLMNYIATFKTGFCTHYRICRKIAVRDARVRDARFVAQMEQCASIKNEIHYIRLVLAPSVTLARCTCVKCLMGDSYTRIGDVGLGFVRVCGWMWVSEEWNRETIYLS